MTYLVFNNLNDYNNWIADIDAYYGFPKKNKNAITKQIDYKAQGTVTYTDPITRSGTNSVVAFIEYNCPQQFIDGQVTKTRDELVALGWFADPYAKVIKI